MTNDWTKPDHRLEKHFHGYRFALILIGLVYLAGLSQSGRAQSIRMKDQSDWWSLLNEKFRAPDVRSKDKDIDDKNFQIAGVAVGGELSRNLESKLGRGKSVERGDASTGREQVCYRPTDDHANIHLVFEFGEVQSTYYLFADGADWKGSSLCTRSKQVSKAVSTASGLTLGMTRDQVVAILGEPDMALADRIVYSRKVEKKTSPEEFEILRKEYPDKLSDEVAHRKFDFQTVVMYIEARFGNSKLTYLAASKTS